VDIRGEREREEDLPPRPPPPLAFSIYPFALARFSHISCSPFSFFLPDANKSRVSI
jgi:hypothetical protein